MPPAGGPYGTELDHAVEDVTSREDSKTTQPDNRRDVRYCFGGGAGSPPARGNAEGV